jgi:hypothetical protein
MVNERGTTALKRKRCECGSYLFPLHHCPLVCRACLDGTCVRTDTTLEPFIKPLETSFTPSSPINAGHPSFFDQIPPTAELTTLSKLVFLSLLFIIPLALSPAE